MYRSEIWPLYVVSSSISSAMVMEFINSGDISIVKITEDLLKFSKQLISQTPHGNGLPERNPCDKYVDEFLFMSDFTGHQYS